MSLLEEPRSSRIEAPASGRESVAAAPPRLPQVVIGKITGFADDGSPFVDFPGTARQAPLAALSTGSVGRDQVGREAALLFVGGDPLRPLIVGLVHHPEAEPTSHEAPAAPGEIEARLDGGRVVLTAEREIELRCGKASLILTRAGKVLIRGAYLLSRSSGVNRIKGGSVQIN